MREFEISSVRDIYKLVNSHESSFGLITIDAEKLISRGVLRYALKHAYRRLFVGGAIEIRHSADTPLSQKKYGQKLGRWQYISLLSHLFAFKAGDLYIDRSLVGLKKSIELQRASGVSIGYVFSGKEAELEQLHRALALLNEDASIETEVVICGPSNFTSKDMIGAGLKIKNIRYLSYDLLEVGGRVLLAAKKNYLYQNLRYDLRVIAHTRIQLPSDFYVSLFASEFDVATPKVFDVKGRRYLDAVFVSSFEADEVDGLPSFSGELYGDKFFHMMVNRLPYADGGIIAMDSRKIEGLPFNPRLAWGEGEDLDLARNAFSQGLIVDLLGDVSCTSLTRKYRPKTGSMNTLAKEIKLGLASLGWF